MLIPWERLCEDNEQSRCLLENLLEVAAADPLIFDEIMRGLLHEEPDVRMQAADMVEKVTRVRPLFLTPYKRVLLNEFAIIEQVEVRLQIALLYRRVFWDAWDMQQAVALLEKWIETEEDENIIINSMESLYTLAMQKEWIRPTLLKCLKVGIESSGVPVRNLAKKLMDSF